MFNSFLIFSSQLRNFSASIPLYITSKRWSILSSKKNLNAASELDKIEVEYFKTNLFTKAL
ncbi:hypothetical protein QW060_19300 [Myroides ceti]|uniref:Ribosomal protein L32 n=1 Tax=Paenimyroides ceti TaxID=395087 RepID=A0ABT8CXS4_9FLAO|nr:hypothetical protein [Paenimyroides ceti]MDN3707769.1 hypothetical protein [Paenimyroides ceti]MDN3709182.1 hypothetical protein [Paenimyroides ceti]